MTTSFTIMDQNGSKNRHIPLHEDLGTPKNFRKNSFSNKVASAMTSVVCAKVFWVLLVAAGSAILIYGLYKSKVERFYGSPAGTNSYNVITKIEMDFPEIYICPTNYINKTYLEETKSAEELLRLYRTSLVFQDPKNMNGNPKSKGKREADEEEDILPESANKDVSRSVSDMLSEKFMSIGYDQNQMFISCGFRSLFLEVLPCKDLVKSVLDPNFGKCYLASVDSTKTQKIPGQGLILVLNMKTDLYPSTPALAPLMKGYVLRIAKQTNPANFQFTYVQSGTYTKIDIAEEHSTYENDQCVPESENKIKLLKGNYTQSGCLLDCLFTTIEDKCDCIPLIDRYFLQDTIAHEVTYCSMDRIKSCVLPNVTQSYEEAEKLEQCRSQCKPPCDVWKYHARPTNVPLNEQSNIIVQNNHNVSDIMYLHIAFSSLETTEFRQSGSGKADGKFWNPRTPQQESLWVVAAIVLIVQVPVVIAVICLMAMYGKHHSKMTNP